MSTGFPGGASKRRIARYGEAVTFETDAVATDEDSDWNDATVTSSTTTATAVFQKQRTGIMTRTEEGDEVEVDGLVYVHDDDLDGFAIADGAEGGPTVITAANGVEYVVLTDDLRPNGVHEIEVSRV